MSNSFFAPKSAAAVRKDDAATSYERIKPWVEKYRPKNMDDVASQEQVVKVLKKALHSENLPHLLFYGPPGTGKTSTILALANELFGPKLSKSRVLELNASDERGIQIVREKIKNFSRTTVTQIDSDHPSPPYKIVILDEADSMTKDAQSALRRTMEQYSKTTRFCLICNYVSRIIEPITSRCAKFRFKSLPIDDLTKRIDYICDLENVQLASGTMETLIRASGGDLRKAITFIQTSSTLHQKEPITPKTIQELAGVIPEDIFDEFVQSWEKQSYKAMLEASQNLMNQGFSGETILSQIHDRIVKDDSITTLQKAKISQLLGTADINLVHGSDEHLQVLNVLMGISSILAEK
ncbi:P-loop containing nucleoside triphosphate hydrolase protein [Syncephalastrum racemosum]|uniref:Replication factor C subunit 2 n=1 Tax=Syncephalastrum racemosum TaxID=13706 RepID=A0A1X2HTD5_SYNRA|nr:P-loop containing nucleoside triphosphate hydrolase protein [Syncephalastrum racemosum]